MIEKKKQGMDRYLKAHSRGTRREPPLMQPPRGGQEEAPHTLTSAPRTAPPTHTEAKHKMGDGLQKQGRNVARKTGTQGQRCTQCPQDCLIKLPFSENKFERAEVAAHSNEGHVWTS